MAGKGLRENVAYGKAEALDGIAVPARPRPGGGWIVAGWRGTTWIVLSRDRRKVLADG
jgi:hypothetical protein